MDIWRAGIGSQLLQEEHGYRVSPLGLHTSDLPKSHFVVQ